MPSRGLEIGGLQNFHGRGRLCRSDLVSVFYLPANCSALFLHGFRPCQTIRPQNSGPEIVGISPTSPPRFLRKKIQADCLLMGETTMWLNICLMGVDTGVLASSLVQAFLFNIRQGRILAVWILAAKLPNSDLNFAVEFLVDFSLLFFPRKKARKNPPKNPPQNSPVTLF